MNAIEAHNLIRRYSSGRGLAGVSLTVPSGQCWAILGANGSGKSTLVRLIAGLERPDGGTLRVLGCPAPGGRRGYLRRCGIALDATAQWDTLSGRCNAQFVAAQYGRGRDAVDALLAAAGLATQADAPVSAYSFGMRRKLAMLEAMVHDPDLLVLDEPAAGVDAQFLVALAEHICARTAAGRTTVLSGNSPEWFAEVADCMVVLHDGAVAAEGTVAELLQRVEGSDELVITLAGPAVVARPDDVPGIKTFVQDDLTLTVVVASASEAIGPLAGAIDAAGGRIAHLDVRAASLRDVLLSAAGPEDAT